MSPYAPENLRPRPAAPPRPANRLETPQADCGYCGKPTRRVASNGRPCCADCADLPGLEAL